MLQPPALYRSEHRNKPGRASTMVFTRIPCERTEVNACLIRVPRDLTLHVSRSVHVTGERNCPLLFVLKHLALDLLTDSSELRIGPTSRSVPPLDRAQVYVHIGAVRLFLPRSWQAAMPAPIAVTTMSAALVVCPKGSSCAVTFYHPPTCQASAVRLSRNVTTPWSNQGAEHALSSSGSLP
jgi:hypothetical protein